MKSGASDPFTEDGPSKESEPETDSEELTTQETEVQSESISKNKSGETTSSFSREQLPYILRREKVKDERPDVHQLFVQQNTSNAAIKAERDLEDRLEDSLARTDAREAIYLAGMQHLDEAEDILRKWGYDL